MRIIAALFALALCACAPETVTVRDAWVRTPAPAAANAAAYLTLVNNTRQPAELVGVDTALFNSATVHETRERDGVLSMVSALPMRLAPGEKAELRPGGLHIMLSQPRRQLQEGERIAMSLRFADGTTLPVEARVSALAP